MAKVPNITPKDIEKAREKYLAKSGRPTKYNAEVAAEIISRLEAGETMTAICKDEHLPAIQTVYDWKWKILAFGEAVERARKGAHAESLVDQSKDALMDAVASDMPTVRLAEARAKHFLELGRVHNPGRFGNQVKVHHDHVVETMADRIKRLTGAPVDIPVEFSHVVEE